MGQAVLTATFTGPLPRGPHGRDALRRARPADAAAATETLLNDHQFCYPRPVPTPSWNRCTPTAWARTSLP